MKLRYRRRRLLAVLAMPLCFWAACSFAQQPSASTPPPGVVVDQHYQAPPPSNYPINPPCPYGHPQCAPAVGAGAVVPPGQFFGSVTYQAAPPGPYQYWRRPGWTFYQAQPGGTYNVPRGAAAYPLPPCEPGSSCEETRDQIQRQRHYNYHHPYR